ncbi:GIY-YIG nuclease family protein [Streptomyces cyaneofuscatus]|uniref:GIY-YIG nuclease family protein n=1 Tax=Streptomyces cyaneofuscatus TaxID=66883 RepID=UPI00367FA50E
MVDIQAARTALYRFFDSDDVLLYVGITNMPQVRWAAHTMKPWWKQVARKEVVWFENRAAAAQAEVGAIRREEPKYNIANAWYAEPKRPGVAAVPVQRQSSSRMTAVPGARSEADQELAAAAEAWRKSRAELDAANAELRALLIRGRAEGLGPSEMARLSGFTREWVSKIAPDPRRARDDS